MNECNEERRANDRPQHGKRLAADLYKEWLRQLELAGDPGAEESANEAKDDGDEQTTASPARDCLPNGAAHRRYDKEQEQSGQCNGHGNTSKPATASEMPLIHNPPKPGGPLPRLLPMRIAPLLVALALTTASAAQTPAPAPRPLTATFIGNEAWHITDGEYTLMTDFPYQSGYSRYMTWEWSGVPKIQDSSKVLLVTTHQHRDHFAAELFPRLNPAGVIGPATVRAAAPSKGILPTADARFGPIRVEAIPTPHADLEHYSYVIEWHGVRIYLPGDTEEAKSLIQAKNLDVAFVTPWMLQAAARAGAKIDARRVIVVHHEAGQKVAPYQGSTVPRQGEVVALRAASAKTAEN